jgi:ferric-dicitrate binding protein FerR (iron transport regulator)
MKLFYIPTTPYLSLECLYSGCIKDKNIYGSVKFKILFNEMNDHERFLRLLQHYLNDTITPDEREELMRAIGSGTRDQDIDAFIDHILVQETVFADMDEFKARKILIDILSAQKVKPSIATGTQFIRRYAYITTVAAVFLIAIISGWYLLSRKQQDGEKTLFSRTGVTMQAEQTHFTGKQYIRLPDGSTVFLNEKSELSYNYSTSPGQDLREVYLTGEGYFDILHDTSRPFLVHIGDLTVKVLGTAFNVKAYSGDNEVQVAVTRGKVQVSKDDKTYGIITPDEQIVINTVTDEYAHTMVDAESVTSWKNNYLVIDNLDLDDAMQLVANKYNVSIEINDKSLRKQRITATFLNDEDLDHVLMVVCEVINARYFVDEQDKIQITEK